MRPAGNAIELKEALPVRGRARHATSRAVQFLTFQVGLVLKSGGDPNEIIRAKLKKETRFFVIHRFHERVRELICGCNQFRR